MPDVVRRINCEYQANDLQRLLDLQLPESSGSVFDIPIAPHWKHAAEGEVDLRFPK